MIGGEGMMIGGEDTMIDGPPLTREAMREGGMREGGKTRDGVDMTAEGRDSTMTAATLAHAALIPRVTPTSAGNMLAAPFTPLPSPSPNS